MSTEPIALSTQNLPVYLRSAVHAAVQYTFELSSIVVVTDTFYGADVAVPSRAVTIGCYADMGSVKIKVRASNNSADVLQSYVLDNAPREVIMAALVAIVSSLA